MIGDQLAKIRSGISAACAASGRAEGSVRLVAVTKTMPESAVREAWAAGQRTFGENYPQELRDKAASLGDLDVDWHFIGRLQRNKAKYVAAVASLAHAIESVDQAEALSARRTSPMGVLVEVNVADETSKGGLPPELALQLCERLMTVPNIELRGLMTLPPAVEDPADAGHYFAALADLAARGRARGFPLTELSMGMSHDYAVAIRHGATLVRIGTAIFGARA
jgi:pyridoxal phosphate enzyme (YggS family)